MEKQPKPIEAIKHIAHTVGHILTFRAFAPEHTLASHGDHLPTEIEPTVPDIEGKDL